MDILSMMLAGLLVIAAAAQAKPQTAANRADAGKTDTDQK